MAVLNLLKDVPNLMLTIFRRRFIDAGCVFLFGFTIWIFYAFTGFSNILDSFVTEFGILWASAFSGILKGTSAFLLPRLTGSQTSISIYAYPYFIIFYAIFFGGSSLLIYYYYSYLGIVFGENKNLETLFYKTLFDLFAGSAFFWIPYWTFGILLGECYLDVVVFFDRIKKGKMLSLQGIVTGWWLPTLISCVIIWTPSLFIVFTMPTNLQTIMSNIIGIFYVILCRDIILDENREENEANVIEF